MHHEGPGSQRSLPDYRRATVILRFPLKQTALKRGTGHFSPVSSPASLSLSISQQVVCSQLAVTRVHSSLLFFGTSTFRFSISAESLCFCFLMEPHSYFFLFSSPLNPVSEKWPVFFTSAAMIRAAILSGCVSHQHMASFHQNDHAPLTYI